jgi:hypothetical protein
MAGLAPFPLIYCQDAEIRRGANAGQRTYSIGTHHLRKGEGLSRVVDQKAKVELKLGCFRGIIAPWDPLPIVLYISRQIAEASKGISVCSEVGTCY